MNADYRLNDRTKKNFELNEFEKAQELAINISKAGVKSELGADYGLVYLTKTDADKCTNANCLLQYKEGREVANNVQKINGRLTAENKVHGVVGDPIQKDEDSNKDLNNHENNAAEDKKELTGETENNLNKDQIENDKKDGVKQTAPETKVKTTRKINTTPINVSTKLKASEIMQKGKETGRSDQSLKNLVTRLKKLGLAENKQE